MKLRILKKKIKTSIRKSKEIVNNVKEFNKRLKNLVWAKQWDGVIWKRFRKTKSWWKSTPNDNGIYED